MALEPTDEDAHLELMRSRIAGDRRGALRHFDRMERVLGRELGTTPVRSRCDCVRRWSRSAAPLEPLAGRGRPARAADPVLPYGG